MIVRHDAGTALLRIIGLLTPDQRNEIVVELMKGWKSVKVRIFQIYSAVSGAGGAVAAAGTAGGDRFLPAWHDGKMQTTR